MKTLSFLLVSLLFICSSAAEQCAGGYDRIDRLLLKEAYLVPERIFTRLGQLAEQASSNTVALNERTALNAEFQAHISELDRLGDQGDRRFSAKTNIFLANVVDSSYLRVANSKLIGATIEEALSNSRDALSAANDGLAQLKYCVWGSWQRVSINVAPNGERCGGGYSDSDTRQVYRAFLSLQLVFSRMFEIAKLGSSQVFSLVERNANDFDLEYLKEELKILGTQYRPGISRKTRNFFSQVFNPVYLGVINSTVNGATMVEAQNNSIVATNAILQGWVLANRCRNRL